MIYTANGEDAKSSILQNESYLRFSDLVFERWINKIIPADAEKEDEKNEKNFCDSCGEEMQQIDHEHNCTPFKDYPQHDIFLSNVCQW